MNFDLAQSVAAAFGLGEPRRPPVYVTRGAMGEVWRLETAASMWAVKALFEWDPPPPIPADVEVQLAAAGAGVRLPRPVLTTDGRAVVEVDGQRYRAYEWVDLEESLTVPVSVDRAREAGWILGTIHSLPVPPDSEVDSWYVRAPAADRWSTLVERAQVAEAAWVDGLQVRVELLTELGAFVDRAACGSPVVCHRDFDPSNVLPDKTGYLVTLDWENAGPLDPAAEVAFSLVAWTSAGGTADARAATALLDGYAGSAGAPPVLSRDSFNVAVATYLNFVAVMADQALEDSRHQSFAEQKVTGLLKGCEHLVDHIDALVDLLELPRHALR